MTELSPLPVTLITGFLGAGKTTLVNRILTERHGERIAVIVNEFGDVGIDGRLVQGVEDDVVELTNGCLCCTIRGDLGTTVKNLLARRKRRMIRRLRLDRLLIETSGLASPGPVLQTFEILPELQEETRVDGTLTLAHAAEIARQLQEHPEAAEQVGYADRVLLNHIDRCGPRELDQAEAAVRSLNQVCGILRAEHAQLAVGPLLDVRTKGISPTPPETDHHHTVGAGTLSFRTRTPLDIHKLKMWLQFVAARRSHEVWRLKGIARCRGIEHAVVAQGVHQWLEIGPGEAPPPEESVIVLIGRDLDRAELEQAWEKLTQAERPA